MPASEWTPPDPLASLDPKTRKSAVSPAPYGTEFRQVASVPPVTFCKLLGDAGIPMSESHATVLSPQLTQCTSELILVSDQRATTGSGKKAQSGQGNDAPQNSLFVLAQSDLQGHLRLIRVKMNLEDRDGADDAKARMKSLIETVFRIESWPMPSGLLRSIDYLDPIDRTVAGMRITMKREWGDIPRFNLIIEPAKLNLPPAGRFGPRTG
ncbi:hypothetical protein HDIA_0079 [Hartmannibacter diazotrophicus]|uniref:Uncharacterized protein n=1 Tax=Hartmannibacter diazotrophicus TaxID=1482074 RepID=A0A2C9D034_9HYPH|nr:hypothetical protein HDIA_0079 [Hartmannibacter diazotrophicus]